MQSLRKLNNNLHKFMTLPAFLLFVVFFLFPFASGVGISLTEWNGISTPKFIWFQNFTDFFSDGRALHSLANTLLFGLVSPLLMNVFGLLYAVLLDSKLKGRNIIRTIVYSPAVISSLIIGYIWLLIIKPETGALHQLMQVAGIGQFYPDLFTNGNTAMWTIIIVNSWQYIGGSMIIYLAGLQTIPIELKEAAMADSCGPIRSFFSVSLPLLVHSIKINLILNIIGCFSVFDIVMALTGGGPGYATESLSIFIYRMCYGSNTGYATAVSIILFTALLIPVGIATYFTSRREVEL